MIFGTLIFRFSGFFNFPFISQNRQINKQKIQINYLHSGKLRTMIIMVPVELFIVCLILWRFRDTQKPRAGWTWARKWPSIWHESASNWPLNHTRIEVQSWNDLQVQWLIPNIQFRYETFTVIPHKQLENSSFQKYFVMILNFGQKH